MSRPNLDTDAIRRRVKYGRANATFSGHDALRWCDEADRLRGEVSRLREALEVISLHCENANWRQHARAALAAPVPQEDPQ